MSLLFLVLKHKIHSWFLQRDFAYPMTLGTLDLLRTWLTFYPNRPLQSVLHHQTMQSRSTRASTTLEQTAGRFLESQLQ